MIPMPETFDQYRTRVLSYLGKRDPLRVQRRTPVEIERLLERVPRVTLLRRPAEDKWSILQIVAHLADAELAMTWRLRSMIATPGVPLAWWNEAIWAQRLEYQKIPWRDSLARFRSLRMANLSLLKSLPSTLCDTCFGIHETRGRQSVREFVTLEAAHDLNHLRQIKALLDPEAH
jgi:hypothetical protein